MTPDKQRKAAERARKKAAGLVAVTVWVRPEHREAVKARAAGLLGLCPEFADAINEVSDEMALQWLKEPAKPEQCNYLTWESNHASDHPSGTVAGEQRTSRDGGVDG